MNKIDEIKQALAAATLGPWEWQVKKITLNNGEWGDGEFCVSDLTHPEGEGKHLTILDVQENKYGQKAIYCWKESDAHLIANAPEYIAYLLKELEEARKILGFYADTKNYEQEKVLFDENNPLDCYYEAPEVQNDHGERARSFLVGQEGEGNQRTVEVTLKNEGYKPHQINWDNVD